MIINQITLYLLIGLTAALLLRGLWRHEDMLRYPFLAAATVAGWFIPQAIGLSENDSLPEGGFALTMLVAILSLGATVLGERAVQDRPLATLQEYDERTLLVASIILSAIGIVAQFLILRTVTATLAEGGDISGQATGIVTIYFFFAEFQYYGLAIALLLLLRSFSWISFSIVAIDVFQIGTVVVFGGRRGPATELGLIIALAFWFQRRMLPPRMLVVGTLVVATLLVNSIGAYRELMSTINANSSEVRLPTISELMELNFVGTMGSEVKAGSYEVTNAIYDIAATAQSANFDFGLVYWDYLVFRYIPAQIIGKDIKDSLMVTTTKDKWNNAWVVFGYKPIIGTTHTGFSDSFCSFWFLGPLVFVLMTAIMQRWWRDAMLGDFRAKLLYCVTISVATEALSHGTRWFFCYLPEVFVFMLPLLYLARKRQAHADPRQVRENYPAWPRPRPRSASF